MIIFNIRNYSNREKTIQYPILLSVHADGLMKVNNNDRDNRNHSIKTILSSIQYELGINKPSIIKNNISKITKCYF